eukprot:CAMPEP_0206461934 /NCGR_PEP_ID=MMETSP0324_2-20121206/25665_1 /ASSEMBLY_ACC=CAM_ASM_000836 /TAXON_ID=2866 /ORGANISM="Crypthecodinium cohnii, Strain Seligo" /LENGTH=456 /DNA_ID=CAMNT_0053933967 /DNA_START=39 /DNA_END=1409 /DNA_ORIENTATION=+
MAAKVSETIDNYCVVDLRARHYAGGKQWKNLSNSAGTADVPEAAYVPPEVVHDEVEQTFLFKKCGRVVRMQVATSLYPSTTYAVWAKVPRALEAPHAAWLVAQSPDSDLSRGLCVNHGGGCDGKDDVSSTEGPGRAVGEMPLNLVDSWCHIVGVWDNNNNVCRTYINGVLGSVRECSREDCSHSIEDEEVFIGGRDDEDEECNARVCISDVQIFSCPLTDSDVEVLYQSGRPSGANFQGFGGQQESKHNIQREEDFVWDEAAGLWWVKTPITKAMIADGHHWSSVYAEEYRNASASSAGGPMMGRMLQRHSTEAPPMAPGRRLMKWSSDPAVREMKKHFAKAMTPTVEKCGKAGVWFQLRSQEIAVFRFGDHIFASERRCPHQQKELEEGEIGIMGDIEDVQVPFVRCTIHKFQFDLRSGKMLAGDVPLHLQTYQARADEEGRVEVGFTEEQKAKL